MCVVAHPDDECFGFGGALALAADAGWSTSVICLTDGQAATNRGTSTDSADLGRMRREELAASCRILGVSEHELLDYHDGRLEFASLHEVGSRLVERMRSWKPDVVLTFALDGGLNVHPDHAAVSAFTSAAFRWSARSKRYPELGLPPWTPQRLYHLSTDFCLADREPLLPSPWTVKLDITSVKQRKEEAFLAHTSQVAVYDKVKPYWDRYGDFEYYTQMAAASPEQMQQTTSIFEEQ
ncbi:PIG-L family deacetylase [Terriglobus aquaticus]